MRRGSPDELRALIAAARQRSFTKAATKLGVSQAALSQTIRQLETRRGVRLLTPRRAASRRPKRAGNSRPGTKGARRWAAHLQRHGAVDRRRLPAWDLRMCLKGWCRPISPKAVLHASWTLGAPRIQAATSSTRAAADPRWRFRWWWMRCGTGPQAQTKRSCRTLSLCSKGVMHYHSLIAQTAHVETRNEARSLAQLQGAPAAHQ